MEQKLENKAWNAQWFVCAVMKVSQGAVHSPLRGRKMARKTSAYHGQMSGPLLRKCKSWNDMVRTFYWPLWQECGECIGGC